MPQKSDDLKPDHQLLYQTHSPFARKVLVFAIEAGLQNRLEVIHHETSPTNRNDAIFAANPLGKVPVLVLPDGMTLYDSLVICDYLDRLHGGRKLIPTRCQNGCMPCVCMPWHRACAMPGCCIAGKPRAARNLCAIRPWPTDRKPN